MTTIPILSKLAQCGVVLPCQWEGFLNSMSPLLEWSVGACVLPLCVAGSLVSDPSTRETTVLIQQQLPITWHGGNLIRNISVQLEKQCCGEVQLFYSSFPEDDSSDRLKLEASKLVNGRAQLLTQNAIPLSLLDASKLQLYIRLFLPLTNRLSKVIVHWSSATAQYDTDTIVMAQFTEAKSLVKHDLFYFYNGQVLRFYLDGPIAGRIACGAKHTKAWCRNDDHLLCICQE